MDDINAEIQNCAEHNISTEDSVLKPGDVENSKVSHTETRKGNFCNESTTSTKSTESRERITDEMVTTKVSRQEIADSSTTSLDRREELIKDTIISNRAIKEMIAGVKTTTAKIRQLLEDVMISSNNVGALLEQIRDMNKTTRETTRNLLEVSCMQDRLVERLIKKDIRIAGTNSNAEVVIDEETEDALEKF